jgi:hypothetical protein
MTTVVLSAQWILAGCFIFLFILALMAGWRYPGIRAAAAAIAILSAIHIAFYYALLVRPDWLNTYETMLFSVVIRYYVMFLALLILALAIRRERWK